VSPKKKKKREREKLGRAWWLNPVTLAVQEVEIKKIVVQSHPR
jgi:hypothetical protein